MSTAKSIFIKHTCGAIALLGVSALASSTQAGTISPPPGAPNLSTPLPPVPPSVGDNIFDYLNTNGVVRQSAGADFCVSGSFGGGVGNCPGGLPLFLNSLTACDGDNWLSPRNAFYTGTELDTNMQIGLCTDWDWKAVGRNAVIVFGAHPWQMTLSQPLAIVLRCEPPGCNSDSLAWMSPRIDPVVASYGFFVAAYDDLGTVTSILDPVLITGLNDPTTGGPSGLRTPVPAVSAWGMTIMMLLLFAGWKIYFGHRRVTVIEKEYREKV